MPSACGVSEDRAFPREEQWQQARHSGALSLLDVTAVPFPVDGTGYP